MSKRRDQRGESPVQFLATARELQIMIIKTTVKWPRRYSFSLINNIVQLAAQVHIEAKFANSIYAQTDTEWQIRRNHINAAIGALENLAPQIDIAKQMFPTETKKEEAIMELIDKELALLKALKTSDRAKQNKLNKK